MRKVCRDGRRSYWGVSIVGKSRLGTASSDHCPSLHFVSYRDVCRMEEREVYAAVRNIFLVSVH